MLTCWLRSDRIPVTSLALLSRSPSVSLRLLRTSDSRVSPSNVGPSCGAIWSIVADSVSSDWLSDAVLVPAVFVVRSLTRVGQRVGRRCARDRYDVVRAHCAAARGFQGRAPARPATCRCGCGRWCPTRADTLPSTVNVTSASPLLQGNVRHRADFDARHCHVVAGGQAAGFGEQRLVSAAPSPTTTAARG